MMGKTFAAVIILSIVLLSGCTQESSQDVSNNAGTNNDSTEITEDQIPVPEIPDAENQEPPYLPI